MILEVYWEIVEKHDNDESFLIEPSKQNFIIWAELINVKIKQSMNCP